MPSSPGRSERTPVNDEGMRVRREVLGDADVDRAAERTTDFTRDFQDLITRYVWGEIWTRPGLDHRARRVLVIGTLIALGRWEEFRLHARAALTEGGFTAAELEEILLQHAIYCGVPAANTAFDHLRQVDVVREEGQQATAEELLRSHTLVGALASNRPAARYLTDRVGGVIYAPRPRLARRSRAHAYRRG